MRASVAALFALLASPARAELPLLRASVAPSSLSIGPTRVRVLATDSFQFRNDTERCDLRIRVRSAPTPEPAWSTVCFGLDNQQAVPVGGQVGCRVHFEPLGAGTAQTRVEVEFTWGPRCARDEFERLAAEFKPRIDRLESEQREAAREGPDFTRLRAALKAEYQRHVAADERLREQFQAARRDTRAADEAALKLQRAEQRQADLTSTLRDEIFQLERQGPGLAAWNQLVAALRVQAAEERDRVQKEIDGRCAEIGRLEAERNRAIDELLSGRYCSKCNRPASRIERQEGRSFEAHLKKVQGYGKPAPQAVIDAEYAKYAAEIAAASRRCDTEKKRLDEVAAKWLKKGDELAVRRSKLVAAHAAKLQALKARFEQLRRAWLDEGPRLERAIDDARAAYKLRLKNAARAIELEADAHARTLERSKADERALRKAHEERLDRLAESARELKQRWDRAQDDLEKRLLSWERVAVDVRGEATP